MSCQLDLIFLESNKVVYEDRSFVRVLLHALCAFLISCDWMRGPDLDLVTYATEVSS